MSRHGAWVPSQGALCERSLVSTRAPPRQLGSGLDAQQAVAGMDTALACATGLKDRGNGCMALPGSVTELPLHDA